MNFSDFLRTFKSGRLNDALTRELRRLTNVVLEFQKPATLKLEIKVTPKEGITYVSCKYDTKEPKEDTISMFMFPTPEGNLLGNDPRQKEMTFNKETAKTIESEAVEVKAV